MPSATTPSRSCARRSGRHGAGWVVLGAAPYVARCERELAACGRAPRVRRAASTAEALTPQELAVSRLATRGLSKKEIADKLVLSVKTIEYHLGNAYAKLGRRSRGQLAVALRPELAQTGSE